MLTDWLIYLDYLEENNQNTSFLRLITPIIFGIIKCHYYSFTDGHESGYGYGDGDGSGYGYGYGDGDGDSDNNGFGDGYGYSSGNGYGYGDGDASLYDEEH